MGQNSTTNVLLRFKPLKSPSVHLFSVKRKFLAVLCKKSTFQLKNTLDESELSVGSVASS